MSFSIITDTSANIPLEYVTTNDVAVIPFYYYLEGEEHSCTDITNFDGKAYYDMIRAGAEITTSQVTPQRYTEFMEPFLKEGKDILLVCMSSGISGSYQSAEMAAKQLREEYPDRIIRTVDTYGASLGEGLLVMEAVKFRDSGMTVDETADLLLTRRKGMCQVFTVDDLMHLRRGGRISGATAIFGTVLNIKPLLKGNEKGRIVTFGRIRGRRNSIKAIAENYRALVIDPELQTIGIAHADCREDADYLIEMINESKPPKEIITVCYEPVTGSHVGPGALALFFMGNEDYREKWTYSK